MRNSRKDRGLRAVEWKLRRGRPKPPASLLSALEPQRQRRPQLALAGALTFALAIAVASVGGVSYAANEVSHVAAVAVKLVSPATKHSVVVVKGLNAGGDQYRPGYGFGDPNHNHSGPPGLTKSKAEKRKVGDKYKVVTSIRVDEQAALYISVLDAAGNRLLLNQDGSRIGGKVSGKQVKSIHYVMLVPRAIPIELLVPSNLIVKGRTYTIHVIAVAYNGDKTTIDIPFVA